MKHALLLVALGVLAASGCSMPHSGERGGFESYAVAFEVTDTSGKALSGVSIRVKDNIRKVDVRGTTDEYGAFTFKKQYGRAAARRFSERLGYPSYFIMTFARDGYATLKFLVPEKKVRFGLTPEMSINRKKIEMKKGTAIPIIHTRVVQAAYRHSGNGKIILMSCTGQKKQK